MDTATANTVCASAPPTWPARTDTRAIGMVRKRATMPCVMSIATETAVPSATLATAMAMMAGVM